MKLSRSFQLILVVFLVLGLYYPLLFAPLNSVDDAKMINDILNGGEVSFWQLLLPHGAGYYYRPLLYYTFILDQPLWGLQTGFMHLENLLWHALNAVLVFLVAEKACQRLRLPDGTALAAAVLFALHPINTEAVDWISGRTDLMAATFILAAIYLLWQALERRRPIFALAGAFSCLLGALCKETAVFFLPGAVVLAVCWDGEARAGLATVFKKLKERAGYYLPYGVAIGVYFCLRHAAFGRADNGASLTAMRVLGRGPGPGPETSLADLLKTLGFYVKKLFIPWPLNFAIVHVPAYYAIPGVLALLACCYLLWRRDLVAAFFLISLSVLAPAFLVLLTRIAWTPIAERYLYIPCAVFSIGGVLAWQLAASRFGLRVPSALICLPLFAAAAFGTFQRNLVWQDNVALFRDAVRQSPDFVPARNELAGALIQQGKVAEGRAILKKNLTVGMVRNGELALYNAAGAMAGEGDLEGARALLMRSMDEKKAKDPAFLKALVGIDTQRMAKAAGHVKQGEVRQELIGSIDLLASSTGDGSWWYRSGQLHLAQGERSKAAAAFQAAYRSAPVDAPYRLPAKKLAASLAAPRP